MHIAALVLGILAFVGGGCCTGLPAIICGHIGRDSAVNDSDRTLATVGMILGYISVIITVGAIIVWLLIFGGLAVVGIAAEATG